MFIDKERALINDLINIAWSSGNVRSPRMAQDIENLRAKILSEMESKKGNPETKEGKSE